MPESHSDLNSTLLPQNIIEPDTMKLKAAEARSLKAELKKAIKGRPLYFALMAPGSRKGKFRLSKKKSDVRPAELKSEYAPYEDDRDNKLKGTACQGVITCERGVLTLHVRGKPPGAALRFLDFLILRQLRFRQLKDIRVIESELALPDVPENDPRDLPFSADALKKQLQEIRTQLDSYSGSARVSIAKALLAAEAAIAAGDLEKADDQLDEAAALFSTAEHLASWDQTDRDDSTLRSQLEQAKEKAGYLPPNLVSGLAGMISKATQLLDGGEHEAALDAVLELDDVIDGGFQDYFLQNLRVLAENEQNLSGDVVRELSRTKSFVRERDWIEAKTSFEKVKLLLTGAEAAITDDEDDNEELRKKWQQRVGSLKDHLNRIIDAGLPVAKQISDVLRRGAELLQENDFTQANRAVDAAEQLIRNALGSLDEDQPTEPSTELSIETFAEQRQSLGEKIRSSAPLMNDGLLSKEEIVSLLTDATKHAEQYGEVQTAQQLLTQIEVMISSAEFVDSVEQNGPQPASPISEPSTGGRVLWQSAKDQVADRISELQRALKNSDDSDLQRIAEYGLHGITGRFQVGLRVALAELDHATGNAVQQTRDRALQIVDEYEEFIRTDRLVKLVDENPMQVEVGVRSTLGSALKELRSALVSLK